jgi:hypothetical protein
MVNIYMEKLPKVDVAHRLGVILLSLFVFLGLSLFKYDILDNIGGVTIKTVLYYNTIRLIVFGAFVYSFFSNSNFRHQQVAPKLRAADLYASLRKEYDPLLGLRAAAFLMVFFGHWFMVIFPPRIYQTLVALS